MMIRPIFQRENKMRGIDKLHPVVHVKAERLLALCADAGLQVKITETLRTRSEQDALYAQGRTVPGKVVTNAKGEEYQSPHQWGVAFDFCRDVKGMEYNDKDGFFAKVGKLGKEAGLFWGGDFNSYKDRPHFEDVNFAVGNSTASLKKRWGTPEKFMASW